MSNKVENILWMAEELDFQVQNEQREEAESLINSFLEATANQELVHSVYRTCPKFA